MKIKFIAVLLLLLMTCVVRAESTIDLAAIEKKCSSDAITCNHLVDSHESGEGIRQDFLTAANLLKKVCDGGAAYACSNLGELYYTGNGVVHDYLMAANLFKKACDGGEKSGCNKLSVLRDKGIDVKEQVKPKKTSKDENDPLNIR